MSVSTSLSTETKPLKAGSTNTYGTRTRKSIWFNEKYGCL